MMFIIGSRILLDDGLIALEVTEIRRDNSEIVTKVLNSGTLKIKKVSTYQEYQSIFRA